MWDYNINNNWNSHASAKSSGVISIFGNSKQTYIWEQNENA